MKRMRRSLLMAGVAMLAGVGVLVGGCDGDHEYINLGTAPTGGAFHPVGAAIADVVNNNRGDLDWRVSAQSTGGSMENIQLLTRGRMVFGMSNSSISYFAVRGERDWEQAHEARAIMTLFPNVAMFVTPADSGIESIQDLEGRTVYAGPSAAGFDNFIEPILEAHGLSYGDISTRHGSQMEAVDLLRDGAVDAAMIGGGVPTAAITQAAQAMSIRLVPFDEDAKTQLMDQYPFFRPATVPGGTYSGVEEDFHGLDVGSAHLITHADVDEQTVYDFVRLVWENREQIAERHRAARAITEENVVLYTGTPFHPGAVRYFREIGIWPDDAPDEAVAEPVEAAEAS